MRWAFFSQKKPTEKIELVARPAADSAGAIAAAETSWSSIVLVSSPSGFGQTLAVVRRVWPTWFSATLKAISSSESSRTILGLAKQVRSLQYYSTFSNRRVEYWYHIEFHISLKLTICFGRRKMECWPYLWWWDCGFILGWRWVHFLHLLLIGPSEGFLWREWFVVIVLWRGTERVIGASEGCVGAGETQVYGHFLQFAFLFW